MKLRLKAEFRSQVRIGVLGEEGILGRAIGLDRTEKDWDYDILIMSKNMVVVIFIIL